MLVKACLAAAAVAMGTGALAAEGPLGIWYDHTGRGAVEIVDCNGLLCGKVVWVQDAKNAKGCGLQILGNVKPMGDGGRKRPAQPGGGNAARGFMARGR